MMLKRIVFCFLFFFAFFSWGEQGYPETPRSFYRHLVDKYFSPKRFDEKYANHSRSFGLYSGFSFHRESTSKTFHPSSSLTLGFNQKVRELFQVADIDLQFSIFFTKLERQKAILLELTPRISFPEVQTAFPFYIGLGAGLGFYPRNIVKKMPALSANAQCFIGLRFLEIYHNLGFFTEWNLRVHVPFNELEIYLENFAYFGLIFGF